MARRRLRAFRFRPAAMSDRIQIPGKSLYVRRLGQADAEAFREIRLEGLRIHPEAFGASWREEQAQPRAGRLMRSAS